MKGIVFTKFLEMVEQTWSEDFADELIEAVDLPSGGAYTAVGTYPHTEMVSLLVELSARTGVPIPELLRTYGRFLFGQFVTLYPGFFKGTSSSLDFAASIEDVIHVEVRKLYPDAELPSFKVIERTPDRLRLRYQSDRHLGDLAQGLMEACITHFGESDRVVLTRENMDEEGAPVCFTLQRTTAA